MNAMLEPMKSGRLCTKCQKVKSASEFRSPKPRCHPCMAAYQASYREMRKREPARKPVRKPEWSSLPSDPRTLDQQLHALRQQKWRYPVTPVCNLRGAL